MLIRAWSTGLLDEAALSVLALDQRIRENAERLGFEVRPAAIIEDPA